jgi:hypothetical protein
VQEKAGGRDPADGTGYCPTVGKPFAPLSKSLSAMRTFGHLRAFQMKILCHFENIERKTSQLRSMIEALKRNVLGLEADIADVEKFDQQADPSKSAYPIAARTLKARDNLVRTVSCCAFRATPSRVALFRVRVLTPTDTTPTNWRFARPRVRGAAFARLT